MEFRIVKRRVNENIGRFQVTLIRLRSLENTIHVMVNTEDRSAVAGEDYVAVHKLVTFNPGITELNVTMEVINDNTREPDEDFLVKLSPQVSTSSGSRQHNYRFGTNTEMTITIVNDDDEQCNPPCGPGLICNANKICVPLPCTMDEQCGGGKICKNGICIPDGCIPPCGPGLRCNANKICVPLPCTMDEQCGGGLFANLCYRGNIYRKMSKNAD